HVGLPDGRPERPQPRARALPCRWGGERTVGRESAPQSARWDATGECHAHASQQVGLGRSGKLWGQYRRICTEPAPVGGNYVIESVTLADRIRNRHPWEHGMKPCCDWLKYTLTPCVMLLLLSAGVPNPPA